MLFKMKKCSICKKELLIELFDKDKTKKDGLDSRCKKCKKSQILKHPKKCIVCDKKFKATNQQIRKEEGRFCSTKCQHTWMSGINHPRWKNGEKILDGYKYVLSKFHPNRCKNGYVLEHRLVVEKNIGRYLTEEEVVHHKDGDKKNNVIENLRVFENQREHLKYHINIKERGCL